MLQCKTAIKTKPDIENLGWKKKKFYKNKLSVVIPVNLFSLLPCKSVDHQFVKLMLMRVSVLTAINDVECKIKP